MEVNINKISYRVITVSPDRDIAGIIDELRTVQEPQIYLYLPDTLKALRNTLNAQLIQNESALLGKDLILISQDFQTRNTAKRVGIPTLTTPPNQETQRRNIPGGERRTSPQRHATDVRMYDIIPPDLGGASPYVSPEVFYSARDEEPEEVEMHEEDAEEDEESPMLPEETYGEQEVNEMLEEVPREKGKEFFEKIPYQRSFTDTVSLSVIVFGGVRQIMRKMAGGGVLLLIGGGILVGIGIFLYVVLPKAEVRLEPKKDRIVFDLASRVDTQRSGVDLAKNIIPGQFLESSVERSQDFLSSGREIREERAQGIITVYNEYSSSPQTLVENTRFISQDGKLFRSAKTVVVPGASISEGKIVASNIDMEAIAQEAGEGYNVGPSTFSIPGFKGTPKYTAFYGKSSNSMEGGFIGEVEVVTADDLKQAGLIEYPKRGQMQITDEGKRVVTSGIDRVDTEFLKQFPSFQVFLARTKSTEDLSSDQINPEALDDLLFDVVKDLFHSWLDDFRQISLCILLRTLTSGYRDFDFDVFISDVRHR